MPPMDKIWSGMAALILSAFGSLAKTIYNSTSGDKPRKLKWSNVVGNLTISAFVGIVTFLLLDYYGIVGGLQASIVGIAGWSGVTTIDIIIRLITNAKGIVLTDEKGSDKQSH